LSLRRANTADGGFGNENIRGVARLGVSRVTGSVGVLFCLNRFELIYADFSGGGSAGEWVRASSIGEARKV
jgi:hypothetical protein